MTAIASILPPLLLSFALSVLLTPVVRRWARRRSLDIPNERSSHQVPTPRSGGIAIVVAIVATSAVFAEARALFWIAPMVAVIGMAILGLADDLVRLPATIKLIVQVVLAGVVIAGAGGGAAQQGTVIVDVPYWLIATAMLFWMVGVSNAFNFMDGIDGIASTEAILCSLVLAIFSIRNGDAGAAILALAVAGAAGGFLPWNFPRASIFLGDVGSGALGLLLALLVLRVWEGGTPFIAAALPLLPFLCDTSATLIRRIARGDRIFEAHRKHFYQLLTIAGWSHPSVTALWSALAFVSSMAALRYESLERSERLLLLLALLAVHALVFRGIVRVHRRAARSA
ncbi:MAG TPA: glycosyl transferase [Thermoanaerobaculia bacterium]|nr:glycosyl transferase [Thermoanaerobaculia bacterium]